MDHFISATTSAKVDWLGYTLSEEIGTMGHIARRADATWVHQRLAERYGYDHVERWQSVERWSKSGDIGAAHYEASGMGCRDIELAGRATTARWSWEDHLHWLVGRGARFSRLDLAIDIRGIEGLVPHIAERIAAGECVSRWDISKSRETRGIAKGGRGGHTLYIGSVKSDSLMRIYDKRAEQGLAESSEAWARVEMQCRRSTAQALAEAIAAGGMRQGVAALNGYFRPTTANGGPDPIWAGCMRGIAATALDVSRKGGTEEAMKAWLSKTVAPSLAVLYHNAPAPDAAITGLIEEGAKNMNAKKRSMLRAHEEGLDIV